MHLYDSQTSYTTPHPFCFYVYINCIRFLCRCKMQLGQSATRQSKIQSNEPFISVANLQQCIVSNLNVVMENVMFDLVFENGYVQMGQMNDNNLWMNMVIISLFFSLVFMSIPFLFQRSYSSRLSFVFPEQTKIKAWGLQCQRVETESVLEGFKQFPIITKLKSRLIMTWSIQFSGFIFTQSHQPHILMHLLLDIRKSVVKTLFT